MEMQGLRGARAILPQHGALLSAASPPLRPATGSVPRLDFAENHLVDDPEPRSDNNNNSRPEAASFSPAGEHDSEAACFTATTPGLPAPRPGLPAPRPGPPAPRPRLPAPRRHPGDTERGEEPRAPRGRSSWRPEADCGLGGPSEGEDRWPFTLRKQRLEGAAEQLSEAGLGPSGYLPGTLREEHTDQELYVVLNVVQEDGLAEASRIKAELPAEDGTSSPACRAGVSGSAEAGDGPDTAKRALHGFRVANDSLPVVLSAQTDYQPDMEDVVLTNKYGERLCGQICTGNNDCKEARELSASNPVQGFDPGTEDMDSSDFISSPTEQRDSVHPEPPAGDTFTGTITINNQNMVVSIENGVLTLAAPPQDDPLRLKEHQDIVLLNYDGGPRCLGRPVAAVSEPGPQEARPAKRLLSGPAEPSRTIKQEAELLAGRPAPFPGSQEEARPAPLSRSRKEIGAPLGCPEPGCYSSFDSRQKLKVHLLEHAEDPRPYRCSVEGCGWAFATSYKLKRHLQSHDKQRPHGCQVQGCGRRFTTVYNLKAHFKVHEQDANFTCQVCSERFRSSKRLSSHQRIHFEPQRPHKCEFPGCEKTFITFSALFSHNRTHFRETGHFTCTYPGCDKTYDKACRLKLHMRSHTGERPFVCNSEGCSWSFTSMSKLLRHKRKHDDDRRFVCTEEGCGKSFTRAEHLKGHSITHLGTKPFLCHAEGCNAKFSARSSLYIHSKKHKQDGSPLRSRCPVVNCSKQFSSRSNLKSHMVKHHHLSNDVISQMETTPALTPSNELLSTPPTSAGPCVVGGEQLNNLDLSSLFSAVPSSSVPTAGIGVGIPVGGGGSNSTFTMDLFLVSSGILTIDPSSVGAAMGPSASTALAKTVDPLILAPSGDMAHHHGLEGPVDDVLPPQGTLNLEDVPSVPPEALGGLAALSVQGGGPPVDPESTPSLVVAPVAELLASPCKEVDVGGQANTAPLLGCVEVLGAHEGGKAPNHFVFPSQSSSFSPQKDLELSAASPSRFLESGGSARTDYRAIQLAKKRKQRRPSASSGTLSQRKSKGGKAALTSTLLAPPAGRYGDGSVAASGGLTLRDPVTGAQYVQIQLLQDDPPSDGDLAFQLSSQTSSPHSQLTVDLPVNILQEPSLLTEDDTGSDNSQFTGSTINLQDLE